MPQGTAFIFRLPFPITSDIHSSVDRLVFTANIDSIRPILASSVSQALWGSVVLGVEGETKRRTGIPSRVYVIPLEMAQHDTLAQVVIKTDQS